jgi:uncharacterized protein
VRHGERGGSERVNSPAVVCVLSQGLPVQRAPQDIDTMNPERKELLLYAVAVLLTTTLIVSTLRLFHVTNNWAANSLMFVPGILATAFLLKHGGLRSVGWGPGTLPDWLLAILFPAGVLAVWLPLTIRLGYAAMAPSSSPIARTAAHPLKLVENMALYFVISFPLAFGEELGWRGYAQNRLIRQFGLLKGLLLLGLLWGFWHTPIFYAMGEYPQHPILGSFVMTPIDNVMAVVPMAWFYLRSRNIWVPTFLHAFADILWGFSDLLFPKSHEVQSWAILQAVQLIVSIVLLMDLKSGRREAGVADPRLHGSTIQT